MERHRRGSITDFSGKCQTAARPGGSHFYGRQVKFFTNFSCEGGGQLLKHGLDFVVSRTTFDW
jgi:hypothetical protein